MSRYKAYPAYRDSGVEWLGEIPPHWHSRQLKYLCSYNDEVLSETVGDDFEIEYVDIGSVSAIDGISGTETLLFGNAPSRARRIVRDGDILISTVRTYLEAIASVKAPPNNLIASTGFAVIRPNLFLNKGYAAYCLRASGFIKEVVARSVGVSYPAINASDLVNIKTPEPSPTEQENIAAFLDHETAKIDALIEKQQRLIELLKEKRQAVISHAVTKGLNPNAPMKDSGVEWLGEVPAHWVVSRVKDVTTKIVDGPHFSPSYVDDGYMFLSARNIKVDRWALSDAKYISEENFREFNKRIKPEKGDVLLTKGGTTGVARAVDLDFDFQVWVHIAVLKTVKRKIDHFFLAHTLNGKSCYEQSQLSTYGATNNDLGLSRIANIVFAAPPLEEQHAICDFINDKCSKLDNLISNSLVSIELMQERRTALISAAVTGKIDVRDWQAAA